MQPIAAANCVIVAFIQLARVDAGDVVASAHAAANVGNDCGEVETLTIDWQHLWERHVLGELPAGCGERAGASKQQLIPLDIEALQMEHDSVPLWRNAQAFLH